MFPDEMLANKMITGKSPPLKYPPLKFPDELILLALGDIILKMCSIMLNFRN